MEYKTEVKHIRTSPRKLREVADVVRKQSLGEALTSLEFLNKKAAAVLLKAFKSAIANAENNHSKLIDNLILNRLEINEGIALKRWRPVSRGSAHPYRKKMSHIKIVLADKAK